MDFLQQSPMMMPMGQVSSAPQMVAPMKIPAQSGLDLSGGGMQKLAQAMMLARSRKLLNTLPPGIAAGTAMSDAGSAVGPPPLNPTLATGPMNA